MEGIKSTVRWPVSKPSKIVNNLLTKALKGRENAMDWGQSLALNQPCCGRLPLCGDVLVVKRGPLVVNEQSKSTRSTCIVMSIFIL